MKNAKHAIAVCRYRIIIKASFPNDILTEEHPGVSSEIQKVIDSVFKDQVTLHESRIFGTGIYLHVDISPDLGVKTYVDKIKRQTASMLYREFPMFHSRVSAIWSRKYFVWSESDGRVYPESFEDFFNTVKEDINVI